MNQQQRLDRGRVLAKLFTRPMMAMMARTGTAVPAFRILQKLDPTIGAGIGSLGSVFDDCFDELSTNYRCEYVYKSAIADRIVFGRHSPRTAGMQLELPVGRSIVDVAIFNGTSTAYEIKTEFDSAKRLNSQSSDYLKAFDRVYVVTHPSLIDRYIASVDERVGILALSRRNRLSEVRAATGGICRLDPAIIFRMLRRSEYVDAVTHYFGKQPSLPNGLICAHYGRMFELLTSAQAHDVFVEALRLRTANPATAGYISTLPRSLRVLGYATPLSGIQRDKLLSLVT